MFLHARIRLAGLLLLLGAVACTPKAQEEVPKHDLTEQEQKKLQLEEAFSPLIQQINLDEAADIRQYITQHSSVSLGLDGAIIYTLHQDGQTLVRLSFLYQGMDNWKVDGNLYGGLEVHGSLHPLGMVTDRPKNWENHWDLHIYNNGEDVATLGMEVYEQKWVPVFRFPDGTSYSLSSVVLIEPLVDYLLEHVFSTE